MDRIVSQKAEVTDRQCPECGNQTPGVVFWEEVKNKPPQPDELQTG